MNMRLGEALADVSSDDDVKEPRKTQLAVKLTQHFANLNTQWIQRYQQVRDSMY